MVDRITPVTTPEVIATVRDEFGVDDAWPVVAEPFTSWVLEDTFTDGRPPFEDVGVLLVDDVTPYELMKLRLLNASHQALCYFGYLAGYRLVHDAAADPLFAELLRRYMDSEATPTLRPVPGIDLPDYKRTLIERFANPGVRDTIARLCYGSSDRIPKWLLPVVRENLRTGAPIQLSAAVVASWARYAEGSTSRASRSTYRTSSPTSWYRWRAPNATTRRRSSRTARSSAISSTRNDSSTNTWRRWSRCTGSAPAPRSKRWWESHEPARAGHRRGTDRHRRA